MAKSTIKILPLDDSPAELLEAWKKSNIFAIDQTGRVLMLLEALRGKLSVSSLNEYEKIALQENIDYIKSQLLSIDYSGTYAPLDLTVEKQEDEARSQINHPDFVGSSPKIKKILEIIAKFAETPYPVLLIGETGTGKEVIAGLIHHLSKREKILSINCAAIPHSLVESELFGHKKGSFTGADSDRRGRFEEADGGTIFLDEIGELDEQVQVKLLRVLQFGEIQRVGSDQTIKVNTRIIAATNQDLPRLLNTGRFRKDLYYRLSVCELNLPPLRERREEIPTLLELFLKRASAEINMKIPFIDNELEKFLFDIYDYPGNIRELENIAKLIITLTPGGEAAAVCRLPDNYIARYNQATCGFEPKPSVKSRYDEIQKEKIIEAMDTFGGNINETAKFLGLSVSRVYQLCNKFSIYPSLYRKR
jgi:transcriptional regulator with PAS, ATPase and Fis domain